MGSEATPGQSASDFLGGTGEVHATRGSYLVGTLAALGVVNATLHAFDTPKRDPMKPGDPISNIFAGQHVTVHVQPKSGLFDMIGSICEATTSIETLKPEQPKQQGPATSLPAAKMETPKNGF
jgi:hypothetical protein